MQSIHNFKEKGKGNYVFSKELLKKFPKKSANEFLGEFLLILYITFCEGIAEGTSEEQPGRYFTGFRREISEDIHGWFSK